MLIFINNICWGVKWFISYKHIAVCLEDKSGRVFGQAVVWNALLLSGLKEKHNVPFYAWPKLKINTHITDVEKKEGMM